jgi:integrase
MIASGVDVRTAAAVLGHASPTVTLAVYAHVVAGAQAAAVAAVEARLRKVSS